MSWIPVYVQGKKGFKSIVRGKLDGECLMGSPEVNSDLLMFWLSDLGELRRIKMSVGAKLIFKYRLRFFTDLEHHLQSSTVSAMEFSPNESAMIKNMQRKEENQRVERVRKRKSQSSPDDSVLLPAMHRSF